MPRKQEGLQIAATVVIHDARAMSLKGRRQIASWLRKQARFFTRKDRKFGRRVSLRYLYK